MKFDLEFNQETITLTAKHPSKSFFKTLFSSPPNINLEKPLRENHTLLLAIADLREKADELSLPLSINQNEIVLPHRLAAALDANIAEVIGLPPTVDLLFKTDVEGIVGNPNFRLHYEWVKNGQRKLPQRTGAILETEDGKKRIPLWLMEAIEVADNFNSQNQKNNKNLSDDWEALARFRQLLDPGVIVRDNDQTSRISMTDFLSGLEVKLADSFSISPISETEFDVIPFSGKHLEYEIGHEAQFSESMGELKNNQQLDIFQKCLRERGALPAYRLGAGKFLVVEKSAIPVLDVMANVQQLSPAERRSFIQNPEPRITVAVENYLRKNGKLDGLSVEDEQDTIDKAVKFSLIETKEYSERVIGIIQYTKQQNQIDKSGTTWLSEEYSEKIAEVLAEVSTTKLESIRDQIILAIENGDDVPLLVDEIPIPPREETVKLIDMILASDENEPASVVLEKKGPFVIDTKENFQELTWFAKLTPRKRLIEKTLPLSIKTPLKDYQLESLNWQIDAWEAGLSGILNADEQGLGKTLQTISFLTWLKENQEKMSTGNSKPILVVAPASLLVNWEQEVTKHVDQTGLGHLIRLYGRHLSGRKIAGAKGTDLDSGEEKLDLSSLENAIKEGRAHRFWLLTTYSTLNNYQHSLAKIPFAAIVFDEIQALKNPLCLRAIAARAMNADFRIGLTGTPIENTTLDLWAIMDQLAGGYLGTAESFRAKYSEPEQSNMEELYNRVFMSRRGKPPFSLRRVKDIVASDLPDKKRKIYPRLMPRAQELAYNDAQIKLAQGGLGAHLRMLHHIRAVSVHPDLSERYSYDQFISLSGRLTATVEILHKIRADGEKALVFIEHRKMQYRFIELIKAEFGLNKVDLINGDTDIKQRQKIVNDFQAGMNDGLFNLLILGPKAAGTGLTLTAATHVIHLSRWWNPAVEEQCNDRVHRLGQTQAVTIHVPMSIHSEFREDTFDCLLHSLMMRKRKLANSALWPMGDTQADVAALSNGLKNSGGKQPTSDPIFDAMKGMYLRDNLDIPKMLPEIAFEFK